MITPISNINRSRSAHWVNFNDSLVITICNIKLIKKIVKMVLIKEFRITLPMSVEEYNIGQLYTVAETSLNENGG